MAMMWRALEEARVNETIGDDSRMVLLCFLKRFAVLEFLFRRWGGDCESS